MRKKNLNALERMQREKIGVAGDDVASPAVHRKFEEFVVLWITASLYPYPYINIHPLRLAR